MSSREVKEYLSHHHISSLLESLLTGLLYHRPEDPVGFLKSCLIRIGLMGGPAVISWDSFIHLDTKPSVTPGSKAAALLACFVPPPAPSLPPTVQLPPSTPPITPSTPSAPILSPLTPSVTSLISTTMPPSPLTTPEIPPLTTKPQIPPKTPSPPPGTTKTSPVIPRIPRPPQSGPQLSSTGWRSPDAAPVCPSSAPERSPVAPQKALEDRDPPGEEGPGATPPQQEELDGGGQRTDVPPAASPAPPPPALCSQLSIDSDSDMTESFGLRQEVSVMDPLRPRPLLVFIIGGPGSGKGSQAAKLGHAFGLRNISLDDLLRKQLLSKTSPSRRWELISQVMSQGELGPQEDTVSELRGQLEAQQDFRGFVVDGFPRDVHQALSFQDQVRSPDLVMLLLCSNETLRYRLQRRAATLGLLGDSGHALQRRLDTFHKDIVSISRYYRQQHLLTQVNGDRDEDIVFAELSLVIKEKLFTTS